MYDPITYQARSDPDAIALVEGDERWTYASLDREVDALAGRLRALGVGSGDRLGVLAGPSVAFARLVHAARRVGAVLAPFDARGAETDVRKQYREVEVTALAVDGDQDRIAVARSVVDGDRTPIVSMDATGPRPLSDLPVREGPPADRDLDDPQLVLFTSGTTGDPKAVVLTIGNMLWSAIASAFRLGVHRGDRWLSPLPMHHMGGLAPALRSALYGTTVVVESFDPPSIIETMRARGITGISVVPTMLDRLLDAGEFPESVRFVLTGGAPTPSELVARCERHSVPICPTYGTTETASQVATATPEEAFAHPESVGRPLAFTEVTVVSEDGERLVGEPGEIVVDGPTVTPGYLDGNGAFGPRGFHTGDAGILDAAGRLRVLGRLDDLIVTGGENVAPREVADALREHPDVRDAAVVGLDDPEWGERVGALVVPEPVAAIDADDIRDHCAGRLAAYKRPRTVAFADALPRTASGTVDREAVRERLGEANSDA